MKVLRIIALLSMPVSIPAASLPPILTVFVIVLENHDWAAFKGSPSAPYLNNTLLPMASRCEQYMGVSGLRPSLPNYLWLEAGTNFGIYDNQLPDVNHQSTTNHLTAMLEAAGISWRAYQEDIGGTHVPLFYTNLYAPRHNPFVYFDDVTGTNDVNYAYGIAHIRPYSEFPTDLTNDTVARYNFISPNLCNGGHDSCPPYDDPVLQSDSWLASEVPKILASPAYQNNGALFITWDESSNNSVPIGMVVLSPSARGGGYWNNIHYTHSSTLRTVQEIFGIAPYLGDASNATDLSDLFVQFGFSDAVMLPDGGIKLTVAGVIPERTNVIQASPDLTNWVSIHTNAVPANTFTFTDSGATNSTTGFYRLLQLP